MIEGRQVLFKYNQNNGIKVVDFMIGYLNSTARTIRWTVDYPTTIIDSPML